MSSQSATVEQVRTLHPYGFRCGEWATILTTAYDPEKGKVYVVEFEDGATDWWVAFDRDGDYEFREVVAT